MKNLEKLSPLAIFIPLIIMILSLVLLSPQLSSPSQKNTDIRSKAAGNTLTVCPNSESGCQFVGGDGIQQAVDAAADGDIIYLKKGRYTRNSATNGKCFVDTRGKSITIKGDAASAVENHIDGQDDEFGTKVPGLNRVGICISSGNVTLESLQLSHVLNHALALSGSSAVIKNVYIVDIDGVPSIVLRGSNAIFTNSFIQGQINADASSDLIVTNNTFYQGQGVVLDACSGPRAIQISGNIFDSVSAGISGKCVKEKLTSGKISSNLVHKQEGGCAGDELCDFPGKIDADPQFNSPGVYNGDGWTGFADMHVKDESPAKGLGMYEGACAAAATDSSGCQSYISQLQSQLIPPAPSTSAVPTSEPYELPPVDNIPTQLPKPSSDDSGPPITYYIPPTMSFTNPNQPPYNPPTGGENLHTPTITPIPKPLIDVEKTLETAKNTWNNFVNSIIQFTKTILP